MIPRYFSFTCIIMLKFPTSNINVSTYYSIFTGKCFNIHRDPRGDLFKEPHAFIGYQKDTPAAVVFQAINQLRELLKDGGRTPPAWQRLQQIGVLHKSLFEQLIIAQEGSHEWQEAVRSLVDCCKFFIEITVSN